MGERANINLSHEKLDELHPDSNTAELNGKKFIYICKIRRKLDSKYFRWPIELDVIEPVWLKEYIIPLGDYIPRLIVVDEYLSKIDSRDYARVCGRKSNPLRDYSYRFSDCVHNNPWP